MKNTKLENFLKEKGISVADDLNTIESFLQNDINSVAARKDNEITTLRGEVDAYKKQVELSKELETKLEATQNEADLLKCKNYIFRNINHTLTDNDVDDLMALAQLRCSKDENLSFEDALKDAAKARNVVGDSLPPSPQNSNQQMKQPSNQSKLDSQAEMQEKYKEFLSKI